MTILQFLTPGLEWLYLQACSPLVSVYRSIRLISLLREARHWRNITILGRIASSG